MGIAMNNVNPSTCGVDNDFDVILDEDVERVASIVSGISSDLDRFTVILKTSEGEHTLDDGGKLMVGSMGKASFEAVLEDMVRLNPHLTVEILEKRCDSWERLSRFQHLPRVVGDWNLSKLGITELPTTFADLNIAGSLYLSRELQLNRNQLHSLPESFSQLTVGRFCNLANNPIARTFHVTKYNLPDARIVC